MTLSSTTSSETVQGDGLSTVFNYSFPMGGSESYAQLIFTDATGATSSITASLFSISNVNDPNGGTFTYPLAGSPISTGTSLTLYRTVPLVQNSTIQDQGNFAPIIVDGALDYQTMALQQLQREIDTLNSQVDSFLTGSISSVTTGMIASGAVTYPKFQNVAASRLLGNPTTASTTVSEIAIDSTLTFSGTTLGVAPSTASQTSGMFFITSSSPTSGTTVTLSAIPSSFTHLLLIATGRSTGGASPGVNINMTFNGDGGNHYDTDQIQIVNTSVAGNTAAAQSSLPVGFVPWSSSTTSNVGYARAEIYNYQDNDLFKVCQMGRGAVGATSVDGTWVSGFGHGMWRSTASITQIELALASGNWTTGSVVSLYGLL